MLMESLLMQNVDTRKVSWLNTQKAGGYYDIDGKQIGRFIMFVHTWTVPDNTCGVGLIPMDFIRLLEVEPVDALLDDASIIKLVEGMESED